MQCPSNTSTPRDYPSGVASACMFPKCCTSIPQLKHRRAHLINWPIACLCASASQSPCVDQYEPTNQGAVAAIVPAIKTRRERETRHFPGCSSVRQRCFPDSRFAFGFWLFLECAGKVREWIEYPGFGWGSGLCFLSLGLVRGLCWAIFRVVLSDFGRPILKS